MSLVVGISLRNPPIALSKLDLLVVQVSLLGALGLRQRAFSLSYSRPEPNSCNSSDPSGNGLTWFFVTFIIDDAVLHFIIRAAFFILYLQFSAQSNFRLWIGLGFGVNGMLIILNMLIIVFRCKPITAAFRPMERMTAQCMDTEFVVFAPAVLNSLLNPYVLVLSMPIVHSMRVFWTHISESRSKAKGTPQHHCDVNPRDRLPSRLHMDSAALRMGPVASQDQCRLQCP
ncbi:hypothetical protein BU25DRAFT_103706 [Macroventuria anomochaeta]|uniref:Uncharacterized protein n=1 Tax=Macroventuria anomochaeta TaxID=301207 RepID=A0ACB6RXS1_9PLEO|nr:uncharacterized protein BU25DRAFT_103706 [Macroventuria anomochaeta]KAF2626215.1 hypothetical protein BU25DRAFT_103706 [Macroventuria anomochaeta]